MEANPGFFRDLAYVFLAAITGGMVAWKLRQPIFHVPYVVIEVDPDIVETLRTRGIFCLFGDATHERILQEANIQSASLVIRTLPEGNKSQLVIRDIRRQNPTVPILARAHTRSDHEALLQAGGDPLREPRQRNRPPRVQ
jgi:voltage-gated potassium channel Kch